MRIDSMLDGLNPLEPDDLPDLPSARLAWAQIRDKHGLAADGCTPLLASEGNSKIDKNSVPTYALTLAPAVTSGHNVCERSTPQCRKSCVLWTAGRGVFPHVRTVRIARTDFLARYPLAFLALLHHELGRAERKANGTLWCVRLNVASDIRWERFPWLFEHENMRAYDYTKWALWERPDQPRNYRLTWSHSERMSDDTRINLLMAGRNVAMVFDCHKHELPAEYDDWPVIDGDVDDCRYWDPSGVIVGLAAKGAAKKLDAGGFVTAVGAGLGQSPAPLAIS